MSKKQLALGLISALSAGTALADHQTLNSADGYSYYFDPSEGELQGINKTGLSDPMSNTFLEIDGSNFNGSGSTSILGGEGRNSGTSTISGLTVSRETFVSTTENLFRQVNIIENPSAAPIVTTIRLRGTYSATTTAYVESSDGNTTLDTADNSHIVAYNSEMHVVHVYGSAGAAETIDGVSGADASSAFFYEWQNVSVPAGDKVIIMNFMAGADDLAGAQALQTRFSGLQGDALKGIENADYAKIINWSFTDSDSDGIPDIVETGLGLNPADASDATGDLDNDGLDNITEYNGTTDINNADTDGDGLNDGDEVNTFKTDPTSADTDGDGLTDDQEVGTLNYDPLDASDGIIKAVTSVTDENLEQHQPQVATDSLGRHHIVWIEYDSDGTAPSTSEGDVRYKLLDASFNTLIDTTNITTNSNDDQGHPSIVVDANNIAYLFWFDSNPDTGLMIGIDPSKHPLDGTSATLSSVKSFTAGSPDADGIISGISVAKRSQMAVDSTGKIHVAFNGSDSQIYLMAFNPDGSTATAAFMPFNVSTESDYTTSQPRMALDSNNKAHIVWSDSNDEVYYGMADGVAGTTLIDATRLNTANLGYEQHISVSVDSANKVYIVWGDNDNNNASDDGAPKSKLMFGSLDPSLDDQSGDAALLATVGFTPTAIAIADTNAWYMHSNMTADNQITISYNTGGGNGLSPLNYLQIDSAGAISKEVQEIAIKGAGNYTSYGNYAHVGDKAIVFATDTDPKNIKILDLAAVYAPEYPATELTLLEQLAARFGVELGSKTGASSWGLFSLMLLLLPMGLRFARKRD